MTRIGVTELEYNKAKSIFDAAARDGLECMRVPAGEADLAEAVGRCGVRHLIVGVERYTGPLYDALPKGGVIARFGIGHDGIDKDLATRRGLLCTNTPGVLDDSVAELTIALILAAARHVPAVSGSAKQGRWTPIVGAELKGKTLAVIGCGAIGRRVARIASRGLQMNVVGCDVACADIPRMKAEFGLTEVRKEFADVAGDADYVSLHIPSIGATRHFIQAQRLSQMAARAWLINTARGAVVDESALFDAIDTGRLAGAALDVFEREPYEPVAADKDLRTLDRVIMTPHVGSSTQEACDRMAQRALHNIKLAEAGRFSEMDLLNPHRT